MRDPDPVVILDCGHVEHPPASVCCQTIGCPNRQPVRKPFYEWVSAGMVGAILWSVQHATGRGMVEILMDSLPRLFTS